MERRILKVVNSNDTGGVFTCESQFLKHFAESGVEIDLVIVGNGDKLERYSDLARNSVQIPQIDVLYSGSILNRIISIIESWRYGRRNIVSILGHLEGNYDAVVYRRENLMFLSSLLAKKFNIPCFWHMANSVGSKISKNVYVVLCKLLKINPIANSKYTKSTLGNICKHVVYPGYEEKRVVGGSPTYRKQYNISESEFVYGMLTRIDEDKAIDIVINSFTENFPATSKVHLLIAGGPLDSEFAISLKKIIGKSANIRLVGPIADTKNFYESVDVVINGRKNAEPFGITIAESLAAAKPVIAFYKGGPEEMIIDGKNGWLVKNPSVEGYSAAIVKAYRNRESLLEMGKLGRDMAPKFAAKVNADKLLRIVDDMTGRKTKNSQAI